MTTNNSNQSMPTPQPQGSTGLSPDEMRTIAKIRKCAKAAEDYRDAALSSEAKANRRTQRLIEQAEREVDLGKPLARGSTPEDVAKLRAGTDPRWKTHAADNRWHLEQSRTESALALVLIEAFREGIYL